MKNKIKILSLLAFIFYPTYSHSTDSDLNKRLQRKLNELKDISLIEGGAFEEISKKKNKPTALIDEIVAMINTGESLSSETMSSITEGLFYKDGGRLLFIQILK